MGESRSGCSAAVHTAVIIAGQHHCGLEVAWEVPEAGQRPFGEIHLQYEVCKQALLFIGLRNGDLVAIDIVGLRIEIRVAVEKIVGANRSTLAIALCPDHAGLPWRVYTTERARS